MNTRALHFISWITLAFLPINAVFAAPAGQITTSSGNVTVSSPQGAPKSAAGGETLESGQTVTVGEGAKAVIKFRDGQIIALQSKSLFKVDSYKYDQAAPEKGESFFSLLQGGLRAITGLIGSSNRAGWKLGTPAATIGIRGTEFLAVIQQSVYLKVDAGAISATNSAGTAVFSAGQTAAVASSAALGIVVPASAIPAGTFGELAAINLGAVGAPTGTGAGGAATTGTSAGGAAAGAGAAAVTGGAAVTATVFVIPALIVGAAAAAANNEAATATHH
jgi:hypothetical protein